MAYTKKVAKKPKSTKHVCSECIEFFDAKDLFIAQVPDRDYKTIYCAECIKELGITEFRPYHKVAEKKTKVEKVPTTKKATPKTKKATTPKTKTETVVEKPKRKYTKKSI